MAISGITAARVERKREIEALALLDSEDEMVDSLREIATLYGKILGISRLPTMIQAHREDAVFLVDYETTVDALSAAHDLNCPLIGFTTLLVSVPRHAPTFNYAPAQ